MRSVLVTGGSGQLAAQVARQLTASGALVRVAGRGSRPTGHPLDAQWCTVDYHTRAGLDRALAGVDVVVHCAGGGAKAQAHTMAALLSSGKRARVPHLVYISIVGVDQLQLSYYRAKFAAERALIASGVGWSILRATQFHELALRLVRSMSRGPVALVPRGISVQPVASDEVAARLATLAAGDPVGRSPDLGGPEIDSFANLARLYLHAVGRPQTPVVQVPLPGRLAASLRAGRGLSPDHGDGLGTFADHLRLSAPGR